MKATQRKALLPLLFVVGSVPLIAAAVFIPEHLKKERERTEAAARTPNEDRLLRFSFAMAPSERAAVFGVDAIPAGKPIQFKEPAVFKEVLFGVGGPTHSIDLRGGAKLDMNAIVSRLATLFPSLLTRTGDPREVNADKTVLRIDARKTGMYTGRIELMTWLTGPQSLETIDAFFAAICWAAIGGPELTPAQLRLVQKK